jgi:hypothetical protein
MVQLRREFQVWARLKGWLLEVGQLGMGWSLKRRLRPGMATNSNRSLAVNRSRKDGLEMGRTDGRERRWRSEWGGKRRGLLLLSMICCASIDA